MAYRPVMALLTLMPSACLVAQAPSYDTDRFVREINGDPDALQRALEAGADPNQRTSEGLSLLGAFGREHPACLEVLLKSKRLVLNDPDGLGCSALRDLMRYPAGFLAPNPRSLKLMLDAGAKPFWRDEKGNRVDLIPFLMPLASSRAVKVALNHPACMDQWTGNKGMELLRKAVESQPNPPGWCGTGYDSYISEFNTCMEEVVRKCLKAGIKPDESLWRSALDDPEILVMFLRAEPALSPSRKRSLFEQAIKLGNGNRLVRMASEPSFQPLDPGWPFEAWLEEFLEEWAPKPSAPQWFDHNLVHQLIDLGSIPEPRRLGLYWKFQDRYAPLDLCDALKLDPDKVMQGAPERMAALFHAIALDDDLAVQKELEAGALLTWRDGRGRTPIRFAAWKGSAKALSVLLASNQGRHAGFDEIDWGVSDAAASGSGACLKLLMERIPREIPGRSPSALTAAQWAEGGYFDSGPIGMAAAHGHLDILRMLRDGKLGPDFSRKTWDNALIASAQSGQYETFRALVEEFGAVPGELKKDADRSFVRVYYRRDALWAAAHSGNLDLVRFLLRWQSNHADHVLSLRAALEEAVERENLAAMDLLIQRGNPSPDAIGFALSSAVELGRSDLVDRLLKVHVDWGTDGSMPVDAMATAAVNGRLDLVDKLFHGGVDPNDFHHGRAPVLIQIWNVGSYLHPSWKAKPPSVAVIRHLLSVERADPNAHGPNGPSPLQEACMNGGEDQAIALLAAGADPSYFWEFSGNGGSLMNLARDRGMTRLVQALKLRGAAHSRQGFPISSSSQALKAVRAGRSWARSGEASQ